MSRHEDCLTHIEIRIAGRHAKQVGDLVCCVFSADYGPVVSFWRQQHESDLELDERRVILGAVNQHRFRNPLFLPSQIPGLLHILVNKVLAALQAERGLWK